MAITCNWNKSLSITKIVISKQKSFLQTKMNISHVFSWIVYSAAIIFGLTLDERLLTELPKVKETTLRGLGFKKTTNVGNRVTDPFLMYILEHLQEKKMCVNFDQVMFGQSVIYADLSKYPEFEKIHSECRRNTENSTCFATCIFYEIIKRDTYGDFFFRDAKSYVSYYYDKSTPYPHLVFYDLHTHENIICLPEEYRSFLLNNLISCKLYTPTEFCIVDEEELNCDPAIGNCHFDEKTDVSVITMGHKAFPLTCGPLAALNWKLFENSSKLQCILPQGNKHSNARDVFQYCDLCAYEGKEKSKVVVEFFTPPTKEEFAKVAYSGRPIIIRNGSNFEKTHLLNISYIKQIYKQYFTENKMDCEYIPSHSPFVSLEEALSYIDENNTLDEGWYISWQLCNPKIQELFKEVIPTPKFIPDDYRTAKNPWILVGPPGDGALPHIDHIQKPTWQAQLSGSKKWMLRSPPECGRVCNKWISITINEGDLFVIENGMWHHGTVVQPGKLSIAISTDYQDI